MVDRSKSNEQRPAQTGQLYRVPVRFSVKFSSKYCNGSGMVQNISSSGALIEDAEPPLLAGGEVKLEFSLFADSLPIKIKARVVRETEEGFAVQFQKADPRTRQILRAAIKKALSRANQGLDTEEASALLSPANKVR